MTDVQSSTGRNENLSTDEVAELAVRIAELSKAGLPLGAGLRAASLEMSRGRAARAMRQLAADLDAGESLHDAMGRLGNRFPPHVRGVVLAGLQSGELEQALEQFVEHHRRSASLRRRAWLTLTYPLLLIAADCGLMIFFAHFVALDLAELAIDFGADVPPQTEVLLAFGEINWFAPVVAAVSLIALFLAARWLFGRLVVDAVLSWTPLLGTLWQWSSLAEFCRLLALLIERQMPLAQALELTAGSLRSTPLARGCRRLADLAAEGAPLAEAIAISRLFPPTLTTLVSWGEGLPALAPSLRTAADLYQERAERQMKVIQRVAPAFAFLAIVMSVGFLVTAVFSPILKLIETLA